MKKALINTAIALSFICSASAAFSEDDADDGTLNPDEMTLNRSLDMAKRGEVDMVICAQGYLMVKKGNHEAARDIFLNCAAKGYTGTMTWMSYMEQNGNGRPENPEKAAQWDKRAADAGDPIGELNYGLDLLRGYGVAANEEMGRQYIDRAAKSGMKEAIEVQDSGYDYRAATPDADEWKYEKKLY